MARALHCSGQMRDWILGLLALTACEPPTLHGSTSTPTCVLSSMCEEDAGPAVCARGSRTSLRVQSATDRMTCGRSIELTRDGDYWIGELR